MTEHDLKVERQRTLIKLEKWRKEIKMILDEKKDPEKPWQLTLHTMMIASRLNGLTLIISSIFLAHIVRRILLT